MPYSRSGARDAALARAKGLRSSFVYAKVRTKSLPTFVRDSIFQNCVFQLSSILEDYLWELTSRWFSNLSAAGATNAAVPILTRALFAAKSQEESFKRFLIFGDEADLALRMSRQAHVFALFDENSRVPAIDFPNKIVKDKKFPSANNVDSMFKRLGCPNMIDMISGRIRSDFGLNLRSFMDVRNALAHESPPSITDLDVERYFNQIDSWISAIDREFYAHVAKCSGVLYWR